MRIFAISDFLSKAAVSMGGMSPLTPPAAGNSRWIVITGFIDHAAQEGRQNALKVNIQGVGIQSNELEGKGELSGRCSFLCAF